jgi:hypothetical protein
MNVGTVNDEKDSCKKTPFYQEKPGTGSLIQAF